MDGYTDLCKSIHMRYAALRLDRAKLIPGWQSIQQYILPSHGRGLSGTNNEQEDKANIDDMSSIYDSTATAANDILSAGLLNGLANPTRPWIKLGTQDPTLADKPDVKAWLYVATERMRYIHNRSDLYPAMHHSFSELGGFGTGPIAMLENFKRVVRFRPFTAGEYYIAADHNGDVDTLYRDLWMTAIQLVSQFGIEHVSHAVKDCYNRENTEQRFKVIQAVEPNDKRIPIVGGDWKFRSVYKEEMGDPGVVLAIGGFRRFPFLVPRWFVVGNQVYGRKCPGMVALPDVKQLQKETEKKLIGLDKLIDPPTVSSGAPTEMQINTFPGGHTFDTEVPGGQGMRPLFQLNLPLQFISQDIAQLQGLIKERWYNNLFLSLIDTPDRMTAREVAERHSEKLEMLGPSKNRIEKELLQPLVEGTLEMMWHANLLPPAPPEMQGQELRIEFDSVLSQAQKMSGIGGIEQFTAYVGGLVGVKPDIMDKVDTDELVDIYADRTGIPPSIVVSDESVKKIRDQRAKAAQVQQALNSGTQMADAAKTLSETDTGGNTALSTLQGALPGGAGGLGPKPGA